MLIPYYYSIGSERKIGGVIDNRIGLGQAGSDQS